VSREFVGLGEPVKEKRGEVLSVEIKTWYMISALKAPMAAIRRLIEKFTPFVLGSAPVISAIRNLVSDSHHDSGETRMASLEKAMELQAALNEKNDVQLKIIQALLENVQRSLKMLILAVIGTAIVAVAALAIVLAK